MLTGASAPSTMQPAFRRSMGHVSCERSEVPLRVEAVTAIPALCIWDLGTEEGWDDVCGALATPAGKGPSRYGRRNHPAAGARPKNASVPRP